LPPEPPASGWKAKDETERWVPAFSIYSGVLVQGAKGSIDTSRLMGVEEHGADCWPPLLKADGTLPKRTPVDTDHCKRQVRPTAIVDLKTQEDPIPPVEFVTTQGDDLMVTPFVAGSLELMTPGLTSVPGRPRLFVHGDAAVSFAPTRDVAKEGLPEEFELDPSANVASERLIRGQGSTTTAELKPLLISAGAGVAFTIGTGERRLRIKPSVEYLREEIEVTGVVRRVVTTHTDPAPDPEEFRNYPCTERSGFRCIELSGGKKKVFHGVGPGLEIEWDAARAGPFVLAVYLAGQAYAFLGDLEVEFEDRNELGEWARWSFEKSSWGYRGGVGLRFRWVPK
jgi:hypothetical protein